MLPFVYLFANLCVWCVCTHACHRVHIEVKGHLLGISSFSPSFSVIGVLRTELKSSGLAASTFIS